MLAEFSLLDRPDRKHGARSSGRIYIDISLTSSTMKIFSSLLTGTALVLAAHTAAHAQYPDRPIRLVVPFAPGSATDTLGREIAANLGEKLGQTIVVETKPGAGTVVGATYAANSKPDGYTLFLGTNATFSVNPAIYKM